MGCLQRLIHGIFRFVKGVLIFFGILLVIGFVVGDSDNENATVEQPTATAVITSTVAPTPTLTKPATEAPTEAPTKEPVEIILKYPELGQYGVYYTFNENVDKAEEADKETIIQCYIPAGKYTLTNEGKYPTFVYINSRETVSSSLGWEEPAETWVSQMLQVGDSCEITVAEEHYINLQQNDVFKLVE